MRDNRDITQELKKTGEDSRKNESTTKVINHLTNNRTNGTNNNHSAILPPNGSRDGANNQHRGDYYRR